MPHSITSSDEVTIEGGGECAPTTVCGVISLVERLTGKSPNKASFDRLTFLAREFIETQKRDPKTQTERGAKKLIARLLRKYFNNQGIVVTEVCDFISTTLTAPTGQNRTKNMKKTRKAIASIAPLAGDDVGFDWGTDRAHYLFGSPGEVVEHLDLPKRLTWEGALAALRDEGHDCAIIDLGIGGVTDAWPSAGNGDCWGDDIWLGIADYLSYRQFCELAGFPDEYPMTESVAAECIAATGEEEAMQAIASYIPRAHAIARKFRAAAGQAESGGAR
jgi:hypothetical protein